MKKYISILIASLCLVGCSDKAEVQNKDISQIGQQESGTSNVGVVGNTQNVQEMQNTQDAQSTQETQDVQDNNSDTDLSNNSTNSNQSSDINSDTANNSDEQEKNTIVQEFAKQYIKAVCNEGCDNALIQESGLTDINDRYYLDVGDDIDIGEGPQSPVVDLPEDDYVEPFIEDTPNNNQDNDTSDETDEIVKMDGDKPYILLEDMDFDDNNSMMVVYKGIGYLVTKANTDYDLWQIQSSYKSSDFRLYNIIKAQDHYTIIYKTKDNNVSLGVDVYLDDNNNVNSFSLNWG